MRYDVVLSHHQYYLGLTKMGYCLGFHCWVTRVDLEVMGNSVFDFELTPVEKIIVGI